MSHKINSLSHSEYKSFTTGTRKRTIIGGLSILQFAISIALVFATLTVRQQLTLTQTNGERYRDLIEIADWNGNHIQTFSEEIRRYPSIEEMCLSRSGIIQFNLRTMVLKDENGNELNYTLGQYEGDSTFLKVMKINILQGLSEREALNNTAHPSILTNNTHVCSCPKARIPWVSLSAFTTLNSGRWKRRENR